MVGPRTWAEIIAVVDAIRSGSTKTFDKFGAMFARIETSPSDPVSPRLSKNPLVLLESTVGLSEFGVGDSKENPIGRIVSVAVSKRTKRSYVLSADDCRTRSCFTNSKLSSHLALFAEICIIDFFS